MAHEAVSRPVGPHVLFAFDADGICTLSVGPGLAEIGFKPGELVGVDLFEFYADVPWVTAELRRALTGETFAHENEYEGRILSAFYQPVFDDSGSVVSCYGVTTDVTEQRRTERALSEARARETRLLALSEALGRAELDTVRLLDIATRALGEAVGDLCGLWLARRNSEDLELQGTWSEQPGHRPDTPTRIPRAEAEAWPVAAPFTRDGRTGVRLQLRSRGHLVGVVEACRDGALGQPTAGEVAHVAEVAERCALAIDNALLVAEQRRLLEEQVKFRALADASPDLVAITDHEGMETYANLTVQQSGLQREGHTVWEAIAEMVGPDVAAQVQASLHDSGRWAGDIDLVGPAGPMTVKVSTFGLRHPSTDAPLGSAWIATDVTDLRQAEQRLREANTDLKQFKALVEASPDFIAIAGLDGVVRYVNPAGREMVGLADDVDVTTTSIADYLTEEGLRASVEVEQPAVVAEGHWEGESTLLDRRGGPPIPVAIASFLVRDPETGEPFALATVQRDLTELVEAENAQRTLAVQRQGLLDRLVAAQEAERIQIAADVHDDPVQALAAVELRLGLLRRRLAEEPADVHDALTGLQGAVVGATDRLRALLFDLEPPDLELGLAPALRRAAEETFAGVPTRVRVVCDVEPEVADTTRTVAYRIGKEALTNARKHADAQHVMVAVAARDGGLEVTVDDDGRGLPDGPPDPTPGHRGLFSMQDRATAAGGSWSLTDRPGGGTRMSVWLPG